MSKKLYIGVDFGGTKVRAGLITKNGEILAVKQVPTIDDETGKPSLRGLYETISAVWDDRTEAIGIGMAGLIDHKKGVIIEPSPNLPSDWKGLKLADMVKRMFRRPTMVDNDVRCFSVAESQFGQGKGHETVFGLTIGTGIGGGLVIRQEPYRGANNASGEVGHAAISGESGFICSCGQIGHFESMVALNALSRRYEENTGMDLSPKEISANANKGDIAAKLAIEETGYWLGVGLASIAQYFNPEIIVIGGSLAGTPGLIGEAKKEFGLQVAYATLKKTKIVMSKLKGNSVLLGSACLAMGRASAK